MNSIWKFCVFDSVKICFELKMIGSLMKYWIIIVVVIGFGIVVGYVGILVEFWKVCEFFVIFFYLDGIFDDIGEIMVVNVLMVVVENGEVYEFGLMEKKEIKMYGFVF